MIESEKLDLSELSPFFKDINKFDDDKKSTSDENEMIGKSSNRKLEEKWNIKMQIGADFFTETFSFIKELGYNVIFGLSSRQVRIYKLDPSTTHLTYILIDKTEMSEYVNTDFIDINALDETSKLETPETIVYVEFDILDEISLNNKYPVDIYFDTKEKKRMYIANGKTIESRRLNDTSTKNDPSLASYLPYYDKLLRFMKHESSYTLTVNYPSFKNVLSILERKKTKKDKSSAGILDVKFGLSEIDFFIGNEIKSSSVQMYGDDIAIRGERTASLMIQLDYLVKFNRLKLSSNVTFHISETLPFIIETKFGAGKIKLYYLISPRSKEE